MPIPVPNLSLLSFFKTIRRYVSPSPLKTTKASDADASFASMTSSLGGSPGGGGGGAGGAAAAAPNPADEEDEDQEADVSYEDEEEVRPCVHARVKKTLLHLKKKCATREDFFLVSTVVDKCFKPPFPPPPLCAVACGCPGLLL